MTRRRGLLLISLVVAGLLFLIAESRLGVVLKPTLEKRLRTAFSLPISMQKLKFDVLQGIAYFENLQLEGPHGWETPPLLECSSGYVNWGWWSLLRNRFVVQESVLKNVKMVAIQTSSHETTIGHLFNDVKESVKEQQADLRKNAARPFSFEVNRFEIQDGTFLYLVPRPNLDPARAEFKKIDARLEDLKISGKPQLGSMRFWLKTSLAHDLDSQIEIKGSGNFSESDARFEWEAKGQGIDLERFYFLWADAPVQVRCGNLGFIMQGKCEAHELDVKIHVRLKGLRLVLERGKENVSCFDFPAWMIVKYFNSYRDVFECEATLSGDVSDPQFELGLSMKRVLALAIQQKLRHPLRGIKSVAPRLMVNPLKGGTVAVYSVKEVVGQAVSNSEISPLKKEK